MKRFRVKDGAKEWSDKGPDLLRKRDNARDQMREIIPDADDLYYQTSKQAGGWWEWKGPKPGRGKILEAWDDWADAPAFDKQRFRVKRHTGGDVTAVSEAHLITIEQLSSATDRIEEAWALYNRKWPETTFAGAYTCKPYSHGYGDAVDISYGPTAKVFDWGVRMARSGNIAAQQIIGTQDEKSERQAWEPDFAIEPYNGNGSHLWHVHHGAGHAKDANPPCMD